MVANVPLAVFLTLGAVTLPWIACFVGNWRTYSVVTSAPLALIVIAWWIVPESARWMVLRGRIDETIKTLKHCARVNNRTVPDSVYDEFKVKFSISVFIPVSISDFKSNSNSIQLLSA